MHGRDAWVKPMASDPRSVRRRTSLIGTVLLACAAGLAYRGYAVAIENHEHYAELGNRQQLRNFVLGASRGEIVDRGYVALAVNDRVFKVVLNPRLIQAQGSAEDVVRAILAIAPEADEKDIRAELAYDKAYRRLRFHLDDAQAKELESKQLAGIRLEPVPHRVYPRRVLASHVLGRVNAQGKGNLGIEYRLNDYLSGRETMSPAYVAGQRKLLVDGYPDPGISSGHTVVLTVDSAIQAMAEDEINTLVKRWKPVGVSVLVLQPQTGEVLAIANRPTFDPNHPVAKMEQTVNLALQAAYEPGSTMKAITVAAALETGAIRQEQTFFCEGGRWQATSEYTIKDTKPAEWLSVTEVLALSSNICTAKIAQQLGSRALYDWVKKFHFGERPPIQLPGATTGLLAHHDKWSEIQAYNISFGQGMSASPLQVASAFATLANQGVYNPPNIVRQVVAADGEVVWQHAPAPERIVRPTTAQTVMSMLESVVHSDKGTGKNARIDGYRVAGKTSTAQIAARQGGYDEQLHYASFVGAVPAREPRVIILVSVDRPEGGQYGNEVAAPTFARLGTRIMTHLGVAREDGSRPVPESIAIESTDDRLLQGFTPDRDVEPELPGQRDSPFTTGLPDFTGMTIAEALRVATLAHVHLRVTGTGIAVMQDTPPGPVERDAEVRVLFEAPG